MLGHGAPTRLFNGKRHMKYENIHLAQSTLVDLNNDGLEVIGSSALIAGKLDLGAAELFVTQSEEGIPSLVVLTASGNSVVIPPDFFSRLM
jgi:hypothetical protein